MIDLSSLEEAMAPAAAPSPAPPTGEPLRLELASIDEDPDQPRKEFSAEAMEEMTASIKARGVKSPVSVRPHPQRPGRYVLNFGARRFRASLAAGLKTIPAFIDEEHDDYDQVIENLQRENLTPMEMALFIKRKMQEGEKPAAIAKKLGKNKSTITFHQALIDAPSPIEETYSSGRCTSPLTLYTLRSLHEKFPAEVETWLASDVEITRASVADLAESLKPRPKGPVAETPKNEEPSVYHDKHSGEDAPTVAVSSTPGASSAAPPSESQGDGDPQAEREQGRGQQNADDNTGDMSSWPKGKAVSDPGLMKKPLLIVEFDGRAAAVLLNRRPSADGLIRIRFEDNGGEEEVDAGRCKINRLMEE